MYEGKNRSHDKVTGQLVPHAVPKWAHVYVYVYVYVYAYVYVYVHVYVYVYVYVYIYAYVCVHLYVWFVFYLLLSIDSTVPAIEKFFRVVSEFFGVNGIMHLP